MECVVCLLDVEMGRDGVIMLLLSFVVVVVVVGKVNLCVICYGIRTD